MFTGLVEDVGRVERVEALPSASTSGGGRRLTLSGRLLDEELPVGASLAVDGVCLTVTNWQKGRVTAEVGPETIARTTHGELRVGATVNLERPMRLGDRLGGHLVAGHVDGVGTVKQFYPVGESYAIEVEVPAELARYIAVKGSITVDGASLTVNQVHGARFAVNLIPHTLAVTTLGALQAGQVVNIEVDLLARYLERLMNGRELTVIGAK